MANGNGDTDLTVDPDLRPDQGQSGQAVTPPAISTVPTQSPRTASSPAYTQQELMYATRTGMTGPNGMPTFPPGAFGFNSRGGVYNPQRVGPPSSNPANLALPGGTPTGPVHWDASAAAPSIPWWPTKGPQAQPAQNQLTAPQPAATTATVTPPTTTTPPPATTTTTPQPQTNALSPTGNLISNLQLMPQPQPPVSMGGPALQYQPNQPAPAGHTPVEAGATSTGWSAEATKSMPQGWYNYAQLHQMAYNAGFRGAGADTAAAIAMAESGGRANIINKADPGGSYGIMQINAQAHGADVAQSALDPQTGMNIAFKLSKGGTDFSPWSTYTTDDPKLSYKQYMHLAGGTDAPGALYAGDTSGGYGIGGKLAFAPQKQMFTGPEAPGGPPVTPEANASGAGGPGGAPSYQLTPAEKAFQASLKNQAQGGRGWQMLGLLAAAMRGHPIQPISYDPMAVMPRLQTQQMPIGGSYEVPRVSRQISGYAGY